MITNLGSPRKPLSTSILIFPISSFFWEKEKYLKKKSLKIKSIYVSGCSFWLVGLGQVNSIFLLFPFLPNWKREGLPSGFPGRFERDSTAIIGTNRSTASLMDWSLTMLNLKQSGLCSFAQWLRGYCWKNDEILLISIPSLKLPTKVPSNKTFSFGCYILKVNFRIYWKYIFPAFEKGSNGFCRNISLQFVMTSLHPSSAASLFKTFLNHSVNCRSHIEELCWVIWGF